MAKQRTVTNPSAGDDIDATWGQAAYTDIGSLFLDKEIVAAADAAPVVFDLDDGAFQEVTLGGNRVLTIADPKLGKPFAISLKQDATGNRTVTWFSTIIWAYDFTPTLKTGAGERDIFMFIPIAESGGNWTYLGFILGQFAAVSP